MEDEEEKMDLNERLIEGSEDKEEQLVEIGEENEPVKQTEVLVFLLLYAMIC